MAFQGSSNDCEPAIHERQRMPFVIRQQGTLYVSKHTAPGQLPVIGPSNIAKLFVSKEEVHRFVADMAESGYSLSEGCTVLQAHYLVGHPFDAQQYLSRASAPNRPPMWRDLRDAQMFASQDNARRYVSSLLFRNDDERELLGRCRYVLHVIEGG